MSSGHSREFALPQNDIGDVVEAEEEDLHQPDDGQDPESALLQMGSRRSG